MKRADGTTKDIPVLSGSAADASMQDASARARPLAHLRSIGARNFHEAETPTSTVGGSTGMTAATQPPIADGRRPQGLLALHEGSQAYWRDGSTTGMPPAASRRASTWSDGKHVSSGCASTTATVSAAAITNRADDGYHLLRHVDALGHGAGAGPWITTEMEDGMIAWERR